MSSTANQTAVVPDPNWTPSGFDEESPAMYYLWAYGTPMDPACCPSLADRKPLADQVAPLALPRRRFKNCAVTCRWSGYCGSTFSSNPPRIERHLVTHHALSPPTLPEKAWMQVALGPDQDGMERVKCRWPGCKEGSVSRPKLVDHLLENHMKPIKMNYSKSRGSATINDNPCISP